MEAKFIFYHGNFFLGKVKKETVNTLILEDCIRVNFVPNPQIGRMLIGVLPLGLKDAVVKEAKFKKEDIVWEEDGTEAYKEIRAQMSNIKIVKDSGGIQMGMSGRVQ